jgi:glycosyltransferase involved in cell wall biosynthesis
MASLVSVPLCVYNGEKYLPQQLDSVFFQTCSDIEVLAFDDASTDRSMEILRDYSSREPRLKVCVNQVNVGFAKNFSAALAACTGKFVAPCDQDDIWSPEKITRLLDAIGNASMAYCDSLLVNETGASLIRKMSECVIMRDCHDPMELMFGNCVSGHAMLFRRELLSTALPIPAIYFHDHWLALVAAAQRGIVFLPELLVNYRQHGGNVTSVMKDRHTESRFTAVGKRLAQWRMRGMQIDAVNRLLQGGDGRIELMSRLWAQHENEWLSVRLCGQVFRNRRHLYAVHKRSSIAMFHELKRVLFGVKLMRLIGARGYSTSINA